VRGNHDANESEEREDRDQVIDNFYIAERIKGEEAAGRASTDPGLFYRFRYGSQIDKSSLRRKFALYVRACSEAVGKLVAVSSLATRSEWELAWDLAGRARLLCDDTRSQLQQHTAEHGC
jgi:hypothetical protein